MKGIITLLLIMAGCGSPVAPLCQAPDVAPPSQYIVNGSPSTDRRSTVYVATADGYCSGTIIGPHTVLTAAHCTNPTDIMVEGVAWFDVNQHVTHPDYSFPKHDLQVVRSLQLLPGPYATIGLPDGAECFGLLVQGYGVGSNGALHEREVYELSRDYGIVVASEGICNGDSGGPLYGQLAAGGTTLVGVSSYGTNTPNVCLGGTTGFVDLTVPDNFDWVAARLEETRL